MTRGIPIKSARWVNILEEEMEICSHEEISGGVRVPLDLKVFEIKTLLVEL